jgi:hypothetical protein
LPSRPRNSTQRAYLETRSGPHKASRKTSRTAAHPAKPLMSIEEF